MSKTDLKAEFVFSTYYHCSSPHIIGPIASGLQESGFRLVVPVIEASLKGSGLEAKGLNGSDWMIKSSDGRTILSVRQVFDFGDALVGCKYDGISVDNEKVRKYLSGSPEVSSVEFDDHYCMIRVTFEIDPSHEKYGWLTKNIFIGKGRMERGPNGLATIQHDVFKLS